MNLSWLHTCGFPESNYDNSDIILCNANRPNSTCLFLHGVCVLLCGVKEEGFCTRGRAKNREKKAVKSGAAFLDPPSDKRPPARLSAHAPPPLQLAAAAAVIDQNCKVVNLLSLLLLL